MLSKRALLDIVVATSICFSLSLPPALSQSGTKKNIIQIENEKSGTKDWMLKNPNIILQEDKWIRWEPKGLRSIAIEGYCDKQYVKAGEDISFLVSTNPSSKFTIDFYRMGYYQGNGGRHMKTIGPFEGKTQPTPEMGKKRVMECDWEVSATTTIPKNWVSGVYLGKLTELTNNSDSYVIFIVQDERKADLTFMANDMTWQAYNRWPESQSLYMDGVADNHWGYKTMVSWDRPYAKHSQNVDQHLSLGSSYFLIGQFQFVYWAEMLGYDITYISCWNAHYESAEWLTRSKGFLSVGHDEYWTQAMYDNVSKARDLGVSLAFFGGNDVFGRLNLYPSSDGRLNRMMEREGRFKYENELMGVRSAGGTIGYGHWRCMAPEHWIFEGTGMEFGEEIRGLIGTEYHHDPADIPGLVKVAYGYTDPRMFPDEQKYDGRGQYTSSCYELHDGKTFVFSASTFWWSDGLSSPPGFKMSLKGFNERKPDQRVQKITQNILDRMIQ